MDAYMLRDIIHATTSLLNTEYQYKQVGGGVYMIAGLSTRFYVHTQCIKNTIKSYTGQADKYNNIDTAGLFQRSWDVQLVEESGTLVTNIITLIFITDPSLN